MATIGYRVAGTYAGLTIQQPGWYILDADGNPTKGAPVTRTELSRGDTVLIDSNFAGQDDFSAAGGSDTYQIELSYGQGAANSSTDHVTLVDADGTNNLIFSNQLRISSITRDEPPGGGAVQVTFMFENGAKVTVENASFFTFQRATHPAQSLDNFLSAIGFDNDNPNSFTPFTIEPPGGTQQHPTAWDLDEETGVADDGSNVYSLDETFDITNALLDIGVVDPDSGVNTFSISGVDASAFEIRSGKLYFVAGTDLDQEASSPKASYTITLSVASDGNTGDVLGDITLTFNINDVNDEAPTAQSIPDQTATEDLDSTITVSGYFSDADTATLTFSATLENGDALPSWLAISTDGVVSVTSPTDAHVGTHRITVTASDGVASVSETFTLTVENVNDAPTVVAISDQTANEDAQTPISLAGFFTDDDGDSLSYTATLENGDPLPSWLTISGDGVLTADNPSNDDVGTYSITVTASDGNGGTVDATFTLNVQNVNDDPTQTHNRGAAYDSGAASVVLSARLLQWEDEDTDDGADQITYTLTEVPASGTLQSNDGSSWTALVVGGTFTQADINAGRVRYVPDASTPASASFKFTVSDGESTASAEQTFDITIREAYQLPVGEDEDGDNTVDLSSETDPQSIKTGEGRDNVKDGQGDDRIVAGRDDDMVDLGTGGTDEVVYEFEDSSDGYIALDGGDDIVDFTRGEDKLIFGDTSGTEFLNDVNDKYKVMVNWGKNADGDWQVEGLYFLFVDAVYSSSGGIAGSMVSLTFTNPISADEFLTLVDNGGANDGYEDGLITTAEALLAVLGMDSIGSETLAPTIRNNAPTVDSPIADQTVNEDSPVSIDVSTAFNDADAGDTLTFSVTGNPSWLTFDGTNTLSGTPENGDVGSYTITVTATDGDGATATDEFTITVANTNDAPTVANAITDQGATENVAFSLDIAGVFADVDAGDTLTYSVSGASWLSVSGTTISGTPPAGSAGTVTVTVTAEDSSGATVMDSFDITISQGANNVPTVANAVIDQTATEDSGFTLDVANVFADADGDTLAITVSGASWLSISGTTLSGTPTNDDVGTHTITLTATDPRGGTVSDEFTITVTNTNDAPTVANPIADTGATENTAFSLDISNVFADVDAGDTLTYSVSGASWLSISGTTLSGTPPAGSAATVTITVTAEDSSGATVTDSFDITISQAANNVPTVANAVTDQTATEDTAFTFDAANVFTDADGDALTITVSGASWLSVSGTTLSGTPTNDDVGTHTVTLTANDGRGGEVTTTFDITVSNTNDAPTVSDIAGSASQAENTDYSADTDTGLTFTASDVDTGDTLTFTVLEGSSSSASTRFKVVPDAGVTNGYKVQIISGSSFDYEADGSSIGLNIVVGDGTSEITKTATVTITNVDEAGSIGDITGDAELDGVLTAPTPTDPDGAVGSVTYQWLDSDDNAIDGQTGATLTLTRALIEASNLVGKGIKVRVSYTAGGFTSALVTAATAALAALPDRATTGTVAITYTDTDSNGQADVGEVLTVDTSGLSDEDDSSLTFTYQWQKDGADISGATEATFTTTEAGEYTVVVTATDDVTNTNTAFTSNALTVVAAAVVAPTPTKLVNPDDYTANNGTGAADTIDASSETSAQLIQGGALKDTITASGHGDVIVGGYGNDEITLGAGADTVIHRINTEFSNWRNDDGAITVNNFKVGTDKFVFVDVNATSPLTENGFINDSYTHNLRLAPIMDEAFEVLIGFELTIPTAYDDNGPVTGGTQTGPIVTVNYDPSSYVTVYNADFTTTADGEHYVGKDDSNLDLDRLILKGHADIVNYFQGLTGSEDGFQVIGLSDLGFDII